MPDAKWGSLGFKEQIEYYRAKLNLPTQAWTDLWEGMHARGFVVAGAVREELLADLRAAVDKAITQGTTLAEFRKDFRRIVAERGWTGWTGEGSAAGTAWRTKVIYDTNLRTSYMAGRFAQAKEIADRRPYWRYRHNDSVKYPRPLHQSWDGLVLRHDDPWWNVHFPPNGWGCRCYFETLAERDLKKLGKAGPDAAPETAWAQKVVGSGPTQRTVDVAEGIDPGWSYNVGQAAWGREPQLRALRAAEGRWADLPGFGPEQYHRGEVPLDRIARALGPEARSPAELPELLRDALGADQVVLSDPRGDRVLVGQAIADHIIEAGKRLDGREQFFPLIPDLVQDPFEVWVTFARHEETGQVSMRRRYVRLVQADKTRVLGLVADTADDMWLGLTVFRGGKTALNNLRRGLLVWGREEGG